MILITFVITDNNNNNISRPERSPPARMRPASRPTPAMTLDVRRGPLEVLIEGLVQGSPAEQAASARRIAGARDGVV